MLQNYLPVLIFLVLGGVIGLVLLTLGTFLGPRHPDSERDSPYGCGSEAFADSRIKFDVRYDLVAMLFILVDLARAFLAPWAVVLKQISVAGFVAMAVFIGILVIGFIYEWKKGALEWE